VAVKFRYYSGNAGFGKEYKEVKDFLIRINRERVVTPGFLWGRWEWFFSLDFNDLTPASLSRIGIWEDGGSIAALATYEGNFGETYFCVDERYEGLKPEMLAYARDSMGKDGRHLALIGDSDRESQRAAFAMGYRPTQEKECTAVLDICPETVQYALPDGYSVTSLADKFDMIKYNHVLCKGFNHGDNPPDTPEKLESRQTSLSGPGVNLNLNVAVAAPDGEFASYCGMWYQAGTTYALVEPVATDPAYRRKGLGRAAVLEAVKRCGELGAKQAFVGSSQQFYYGIGFYPYCTETFWERKG
jgi:GNAT superfamily N-acetyltransferase